MKNNDIQIIIPMSGLGKRFLDAGYTDPKPLIKVQGRPIIEWVLKMFPNENNITFICRREHLENTEMKNVLTRLKPTARIIAIDGHKKGPVYAVAKAFDEIDDNKPVIISYCDYYMHWDYTAFRELVMENKYDAIIPCYTGFHPHLLPIKNLYASCKVDDQKLLLEIKEKFSFTKNKELTLHSPGVYHFKRGDYVKKYFEKMLINGEALNGEFYVSLVYNLMVKDGLKIYVPANIDHFCQWGTPEDVKDYLFWVNCVRGWNK